MWFVHVIFFIVAAVIIFMGTIKPVDWDDLATLLASAMWKCCIISVGSLLMWYSLYMLGWRVVRVVAG